MVKCFYIGQLENYNVYCYGDIGTDKENENENEKTQTQNQKQIMPKTEETMKII